ncbi:putative mitochondrial escape protein 2 [Rosellinia necatrix]|uniref:Mitochondrial escape protein 2 n=1 Tax=Rosellinia necatrix TaxID=77044 RepID=A0A1W2TNY8_ROSNE|nr:putative mitochondrial escape protein 2 [Rosellinia necatrix]
MSATRQIGIRLQYLSDRGRGPQTALNRACLTRPRSQLLVQSRLQSRLPSRLRPKPWPQLQARWASQTSVDQGAPEPKIAADDDKDGHIELAPNESILWFDNLFPLRLSSLLQFPWRGSENDLSGLMKRYQDSSLAATDPVGMVKRALPSDVPVKVTEIHPRLKDGGAFVKFTHPADITPKDIEGRIAKLLAEKPIKPFFSPFRSVQAGLVKGVPWLEDLHRYPKNRLRIEFIPKNPGEEAVELSQETLYSMFRRYGSIAEIASQPWDSKVSPRFAYVDFGFVRDAIMARNCLHGFVVPEKLGGGKLGTKFRISYERRTRPHRFWDWITNHPRIVIPVIVALLTGFTVVIFDPIRSFCVRVHVSRKYRLSNSRLYRWLQKQTSDIFAFRRGEDELAGLNAVWSHQKDIIEQIQAWLMETTEAFIVVQGPRGSGKKELVMEQVLKDRQNVLVIDCKEIVEARGESAIIKKMASEVGYRPIFSWANSMSSMIDLAIQSTTGVKAGFSETLESQLQKILQTTAEALQIVDLEGRSKTDPDASLPADAYLESHPEKRAVVVIDNFGYRSEDSTVVYDKISEWAAALVQSDVAHVVFLTNDSSYAKVLSKSLPDRVFRHVALGDLSPDVAKWFVLGHLAGGAVADEKITGPDSNKSDSTKDAPELAELDDCIGTLGGRLTDLEYLARRIKAGQSPKQAVAEITEQSASEILKMFLLSGKATGNSDYKWSMEQAWYLVKLLAKDDTLRYNEVLLSDTFASSLTAPNGESALEGLANAELITVRSNAGRPHSIVVGKPVYQAAFRQLAADKVLSAKMDLARLKELVKIEGANIDKAERELVLLGSLPNQPWGTRDRVNYLVGKIESAQGKIWKYEKEMGQLKKVLSSEY